MEGFIQESEPDKICKVKDNLRHYKNPILKKRQKNPKSEMDECYRRIEFVM